MDFIKKLVGVVTGLFCTLIVAWFCSLSLNIDFIWYNSLAKPLFVVDKAVMTALVSIVYFLSILVVARLITGKRFFPSIMIQGFLGFFTILFVHSFFTFKNVYLAFVFSVVIFLLSLFQQVWFFTKEMRISLYYLPIFVFNVYCLLVTSYIAFSNWFFFCDALSFQPDFSCIFNCFIRAYTYPNLTSQSWIISKIDLESQYKNISCDYFAFLL